jgi:uncharacterized protein
MIGKLSTFWQKLCVLCGFLAMMLPHAGAAQDRVALVIGNSNYANASVLQNPGNDSGAMADKLETIGFEVSLAQNLDGQSFRVALGEFTEKALRAELAVVFYAGHGIELSGRNYLIPVDAKMKSEATAQYEAIALDQVLTAVQQASDLGIVMLDACRDNPFGTTMTRMNGTRAVSRGLAPMTVEGQSGIIVSFAAEAGSTADDGDGDHSPYTNALLDILDEPGLEVGRVFRRVRANVRERTGGRQIPIERMQLPDREIFLVPEGLTPVVTPIPVTLPAPVSAPEADDPMVVYLDAIRSGQAAPLSDCLRRYPNHHKADDARKVLISLEDQTFWHSITAENTIAAYRRYMLAFSDGQFVGEAALRIASLEPKATPHPVPTPAPVTSVRPSFNCALAGTIVEHAICNSSSLASQDHVLVSAYKNASARNWVTSSQQSQWVALREAICGGDAVPAQCIQSITANRISALQTGRLSGNASPSYNCARAGTAVERAICAFDALARQDQRLVAAFKAARSRGWPETAGQRDWVGQREAHCRGQGSKVPVCVAQMTTDRIGYLSGQ